MDVCKGCGAELRSGQLVCLECGTRVLEANKRVRKVDVGNNTLVFFILGFLLPQAGLAISIVWNKEKPNEAAGALYGFIVGGLIQAVVLFRFILQLI